jgi:Zn finger protein HypA/HybF involved in hydrogenase expression
MSDVINLEEQERDCDWCGMPTRGRVYEETQTVVCSACRKPLLEIDSDPQHYIAFEEDFD